MFSDLDVLHDLEQIVKAKPVGYRDPRSGGGDGSSCVYYEYDERVEYVEGVEYLQTIPNYEAPACIVGHVFAKHEIKVDSNFLRTSFAALVRELPDLFDEEAQEILLRVQTLQDRGNTWEHAYSLAKEEWEARAERKAE